MVQFQWYLHMPAYIRPIRLRSNSSSWSISCKKRIRHITSEDLSSCLISRRFRLSYQIFNFFWHWTAKCSMFSSETLQNLHISDSTWPLCHCHSLALSFRCNHVMIAAMVSNSYVLSSVSRKYPSVLGINANLVVFLMGVSGDP